MSGEGSGEKPRHSAEHYPIEELLILDTLSATLRIAAFIAEHNSIHGQREAFTRLVQKLNEASDVWNIIHAADATIPKAERAVMAAKARTAYQNLTAAYRDAQEDVKKNS